MYMLHYTIYYEYTGNFYPLAALKILRYKGLRGYGRIGYGRFIAYPREVTFIVKAVAKRHRDLFSLLGIAKLPKRLDRFS